MLQEKRSKILCCAAKGHVDLAKRSADSDDPIIIKKYANRRLYNTSASTYVTLDDLAQMVKDGDEFVVKDAKSGEDITRSVLTQIIFEEENKGENLLPINFLRQLIKFYGDSMQAVVPSYLEFSIESLGREQEKFQKQMTDAFGGAGLPGVEEQVKQNMALFQSTMQMFNPFASADAKPAKSPGAHSSQETASSETAKSDIQTLQDQLSAMQVQINKLAKDNSS